MSRFRGALGDLVRFGMVGGVGVVVDIGVFNLLRLTVLADDRVFAAPVLAKVIAVVAAIAANWAGNRWWAFRNRRTVNLTREVLMFVGVSLAGSSVSLLCLALSHYVLHLTSPLADNISANVIGLILGSAMRFVAVRRWVFPSRQVS